MRHVVLFAAITAAAQAWAQDPAAAVSAARAHVAAKQYDEALRDLNGALDDAERLPESERNRATAAIHFYSAVALASNGAADGARSHLEKFFELLPNAKLKGADRYDRRFVAMFHEVARTAADPSTRFDTYYGHFQPSTDPAERDDHPDTWGDSPALELLGSTREKKEWLALTPSRDRARFIEEFWMRRDPTPETSENEFRDTFDRRVVFADRAFASPDSRGSTTDRGRVFVLLGEPSSVRRRPITNRDAIRIVGNEIVDGTIELWTYMRGQLPIAIGKKGIIFRFVTQKGIGDAVLQREDVYGFQALATAMNPNVRQ